MRALLLITAVAGCQDPPVREAVIRAGRLVDGSGAPAQVGMRIRIADGLITAVEKDDGSDSFGAGVGVLDARGHTVMAGMVNAHAHLFASGACTPGVGAGPAQAIRNLHALLRGGVTTVADLGAPASLAIALRRHVGTGRGRGPRVMVSGPLLTSEGGYPLDILGAEAVEQGLARELRSTLGARAAVRDLAVAGVDLIKVAVQERSYNGEPLPLLRGELLCAVVEEAHDQELRVLAHATTQTGYAVALDCEVDALVHGCLEPLDETLLARLKAARIPVTPTHQVFESPLWGPQHPELLDSAAVVGAATIEDLRAYAAADATSGARLPPFLMAGIPRARAEAAVAANLANTRRLHHLGVPIGLGTDAANCFHISGSPLEDLLRLERAGLSRLEVLRAATRGGARVLNLHEALGLVRAGYRADLIGIEGEPDNDLTAVREVRWLMIDGVLQALDGPNLGDSLTGVTRMAWAWMND